MTSPLRCLVLGGRGFIGSHLVDALLAQGHIVRCFDRPYLTPPDGSSPPQHNFELREGDFVSEADVAEALADCEICFHLVSTTLPKSSNADPVYDVESNVMATLRLLNRAVEAKLRKIVFVSSGGTVYGMPRQLPIPEHHPTDPLCAYGITKLAIEKYLELYRHLHGLDYTVLRIANPFGERQRIQSSQGAVAVFLGKVLRGEPVEIWGDGSVIRDYIYIADVVEALLRAMAHTGDERVFNIGSGRGRDLNEILDIMARVTGRPVNRRYLPGRAFDVPVSVLSITRANEILRWFPQTDFETGLARFAEWLQRNPQSA
jgi:UDP-glucose 4-epimerase